VKTRKMCNSASGAKPKHSALDAMTPATKVPWPNSSSRVFSLVQLVLSRIRLKCGCVLERPVSKIATLTPAPVTPRSHKISACMVAVICLGTLRKRRRLECLPVDCQKAAEPGRVRLFLKLFKLRITFL